MLGVNLFRTIEYSILLYNQILIFKLQTIVKNTIIDKCILIFLKFFYILNIFINLLLHENMITT